MCDAGSPFLLKGFGVLGHILFINSRHAYSEYISTLFSQHYLLGGTWISVEKQRNLDKA